MSKLRRNRYVSESSKWPGDVDLLLLPTDLSTRERILAAVPTHLTPKCEAELTLRAHEPGTIDLSRLILFVVTAGEDIKPPALLIDETAAITSLVLFNYEHRVRGLHSIEAPAGVFSSQRLNNWIDLGDLEMQTGDTLAITIRTSLRHHHPITAGALAPFRASIEARRARPVPPMPEPHLCLAATTRYRASESTSILSLIPEEDGVVDLGSLQLAANPARANSGSSTGDLERFVIESIRLPSGQDLVTGNRPNDMETVDEPAVPAVVFASTDRWKPWFYLGLLVVLRGQQLRIHLRRIQRAEAGEGFLSAAMRFYPRVDFADDKLAKPSRFFDQHAVTEHGRSYRQERTTIDCSFGGSSLCIQPSYAAADS